MTTTYAVIVPLENIKTKMPQTCVKIVNRDIIKMKNRAHIVFCVLQDFFKMTNNHKYVDRAQQVTIRIHLGEVIVNPVLVVHI